MKLIIRKKRNRPQRRAASPRSDVPSVRELNKKLLREKTAPLPELGELDVIRHFTELSRRNFGVDTNFYPLGSCTMKYNPKVNERRRFFPEFRGDSSAACRNSRRR